MDASGLWSFAYSINFEIRKIIATNHNSSSEKSLLLCGQGFWKKNGAFFSLRSCYHTQANRKKLICHYKNTSKGWDNVVEIWEFDATGRAYSRPISHSTAPFCENYTKFYFDAKHLEKGLNRRVKLLLPFFRKKCPFWSI